MGVSSVTNAYLELPPGWVGLFGKFSTTMEDEKILEIGDKHEIREIWGDFYPL